MTMISKRAFAVSQPGKDKDPAPGPNHAERLQRLEVTTLGDTLDGLFLCF